jgi:8-oxo-dGTP pyrophosphatase MutT (NUDIX family)
MLGRTKRNKSIKVIRKKSRRKRPALTHAGGVVYRMRSATPEFLLVTSRRRPKQWVYPKGHVEVGEKPEETAIREVEEEAGVLARITKPLDDIVFKVDGEQLRIRYFLMSVVHEGEPGEGRRASWLSPEAAVRRLSWPKSQALIRKAVEVLTSRL